MYVFSIIVSYFFIGALLGMIVLLYYKIMAGLVLKTYMKNKQRFHTYMESTIQSCSPFRRYINTYFFYIVDHFLYIENDAITACVELSSTYALDTFLNFLLIWPIKLCKKEVRFIFATAFMAIIMSPLILTVTIFIINRVKRFEKLTKGW